MRAPAHRSPPLVSLIVLALAAAVALKLFDLGLDYPLALRLRGDARLYMAIADRFGSLAGALDYAGQRTAGMALFDFAVLRLLGLFTPAIHVQQWADAVGVALLLIHFATAWGFAAWVGRAGLLRTLVARHLLFFFLATCPAMVGHTTAPLSDTLAMDLILCAVLALAGAFGAARLPNASGRALGLALGAGLLLGFSILVRSGSLPAVLAALGAVGGVSLFVARRKALVVGAALLGCTLMLAPYYANCARNFGQVCLQWPAFTAVVSAQAGLRGARTLWDKGTGRTEADELPTLPDATLVNNYYSRCRLTSIVGLDDTSLTGCLATRPLVLPVYVVKKWVGLFDHFRFTPYLEDHTPPWLRWLGRAYASLAWVGLALGLGVLWQALAPRNRAALRRFASEHTAAVVLVVYSAVMLALHTLLHAEDRYSFPVIPLCVVVLLALGERAVAMARAGQGRRLLLPAACGLAAWGVFVAQIVAWDGTAFY